MIPLVRSVFSRVFRRRTNQHGLSLLEMLIYIAISGGVIIVLAQVMATLSRIAGTSQSRAEVRQNIAGINQKINERLFAASNAGGVSSAWISYLDSVNDYLVVAQYVETNGTGCSGTTAWSCTIVDDPANLIGGDTSIAFDLSGNPWVSYADSTAGALKVAKYVGSGGTGCSSSLWTCTVIEDIANAVGSSNQIGINDAGDVWIVYDELTVNTLKAAKYVGSGGTGCTSAAWACTVVDDPATAVGDGSISFDNSGNPWVAYEDANDALKVARYVSSGGNCTSTAWNCETVDDLGAQMLNPSISADNFGNMWVSYYEDSGINRLKVARYVTSGGSGCNSSAWTCEVVDDHATNDMGDTSVITFDSKGMAWVAYHQQTSTAIKVAKYVGSGGAGCGIGSTAWTCYLVADVGNELYEPSIAIDSYDTPWLVYRDNFSIELEYAKYVGSGGTGCTDSAWSLCSVMDSLNSGSANQIAFYNPAAINSDSLDLRISGSDYRFNVENYGLKYVSAGCSGNASWSCSTVDDPANVVGLYQSFGISKSGTSWVSYYDNTALSLRVAKYVGTGGTGCTGNTAWTCTVVDEDTDNTGAYSSLAFDLSDNPWIAYRDTTATALMVAKYVGSGGTGCGASGSAAWTCTVVDNDTDNTGWYTSIGFDGGGVAWISYYDTTAGSLMVAKYVGSGGTGCGASGSAAWTCTVVDNDTDDTGTYTSLTFDEQDIPWISYYDTTALGLMVAKYVGSGGTGCGASGSAAWTCTVVDNDTDETGLYNSIGVDASNIPWISYYDTTAGSLMVAKYVGSGGTGCGASGSAAWTCTVVDNDTDDTGYYSSIAMDQGGLPWISYYDSTAQRLMVAKYVGSGGTGCGVSGSAAWTCIVADDPTNQVGFYSSAKFDPSGTLWISYQNVSTSALKVANMGAAFTSANTRIEKCQGESYYFSILKNKTPAKESVRYCFKISYNDLGDPTRKTSQEIRSTVSLR